MGLFYSLLFPFFSLQNRETLMCLSHATGAEAGGKGGEGVSGQEAWAAQFIVKGLRYILMEYI